MSILEGLFGGVALVSAIGVTGLVLMSKAGGRGLSGAIGGGNAMNSKRMKNAPDAALEKAIGVSGLICGVSVFASALISAHM